MATAQVRRRVERLIALADVLRASPGEASSSILAQAGLLREGGTRWLRRLEALGIAQRRGERDATRWSPTKLGRDRRKTIMRLAENGARAAVPHSARQNGARRAPRSDGEAMSRLVADRALTGHSAMFMVSNGAGDPLADDGDEW